jgi:hypothetical protein
MSFKNNYRVRKRELESMATLGPLVWEEIDTGQTVVNGLAKLLYRFFSFSRMEIVTLIVWMLF